MSAGRPAIEPGPITTVARSVAMAELLRVDIRLRPLWLQVTADGFTSLLSFKELKELSLESCTAVNDGADG